jgi:hypothetical protein
MVRAVVFDRAIRAHYRPSPLRRIDALRTRERLARETRVNLL